MNTDYKSVLYFHCPRKNFSFCEQYGGSILHNIDGAVALNTKKVCPYMAPSMTHWTNVALYDGGFRKHNLGPEKEILIQLCQGYENPSTIIIGRMLPISPEKIRHSVMWEIIEETLGICRSTPHIASHLDSYSYEEVKLGELLKLLALGV